MSFTVYIQSLEQAKTKEKDTITFDDENATVKDLRQRAAQIKNCDPSACKLVYAGQMLTKDDNKLTDYKIKNEQTVVVLAPKNIKPVVEEVKKQVVLPSKTAENVLNKLNILDVDQSPRRTPEQSEEEDQPNNNNNINNQIEQFLNSLMTNPAVQNAMMNNPHGVVGALQGMGAQNMAHGNFNFDLPQNYNNNPDPSADYELQNEDYMNDHVPFIQNIYQEFMQTMGNLENMFRPVSEEEIEQLTDQDREQIANIVAMGFSEDEVASTFIRCGKNVNRTVNVFLG